ncbi:MAG: right-handed parallel beta-helix repeat-containing protein [Pyrinomonadaceae bacterium]|nr:right-handed parallel beta-helix repeat-containing protein [Pyrinomonadaceae bacterium]
MTKVRSTFRGACCAFALLVCSTAFTSSAEAQGVLRFVSGTGSDANNCLRPTPCRSIQRGVDSAPAGAEVIILDTAGYGPTVTINQSITITVPSGVAATIATPAGTSISVTGGDAVILRGLTLIGQGTGSTGINFSGGTALYVENCIINGFDDGGIISQGGGDLFVKDTTIRNGGLDGIAVNAGLATIDNTRLERNGPGAAGGFGLFASGNSRVTVRNTVSANNGSGFVAEDTAVLNAENCVATNNTAVGFRVGGGTGASTMRVSNSVATTNGTGFQQTGTGTFQSRLNNTVQGNTANTAGTITTFMAN